MDVSVNIGKVKGSISYHPLLGGNNTDFGQVTLSLEDLLSKEINLGGFIMKYTAKWI